MSATASQGPCWRELVDEATQMLTDAGITNATNEVRWLVREVAGQDPRLLATVAADISQRVRFNDLVRRRATGEPLQYVVGHWPFRSMELLVDQRALIPRPETEQVAGVAIDIVRQCASPEPIVVDLGVGSGAIALAIATEVPHVQVWGVERSPLAFELASENRERLGVPSVRLLQGSWFAPLPSELRGMVDLIVSNPPYVATSDEVEELVVRWEPAAALFAGGDGLDDVRRIIGESLTWLKPGGTVVLEIGATQGAVVADLARDAGFTHVEIRRDLAGLDRMLIASSARESPTPSDLL